VNDLKTTVLNGRKIRKIPINIVKKDFKGGVLKNKVIECPLAGQIKFRCGHMECPHFVKALNGYVICGAKKDDDPLDWMKGRTPKGRPLNKNLEDNDETLSSIEDKEE
jgi:hypothetical protein